MLKLLNFTDDRCTLCTLQRRRINMLEFMSRNTCSRRSRALLVDLNSMGSRLAVERVTRRVDTVANG